MAMVINLEVRTMKTAQDITVVVPVYNTPVAYLDECLRSLHQQTVPPRKILIMDDGSTLDEIQAYYLRIRIYKLCVPSVTVALVQR